MKSLKEEDEIAGAVSKQVLITDASQDARRLFFPLVYSSCSMGTDL